MKFLFLLLTCLFVACTPVELPNQADIPFATALPTLDAQSRETLCESVADHWGRDWERVVEGLDLLYQQSASCEDEQATTNRLYTAYLAYGTQFEQQGNNDRASELYTIALVYNANGQEAINRLNRLRNPDETSTTCDIEVPEINNYVPSEGEFIIIDGRNLLLGDEIFNVYGVNYYPRNTPFHRFLTKTELDVVDAELDILVRSGINTLRIYIRPSDLFDCDGQSAIPLNERLDRLDSILQIIADKNMHIIAVLNQDSPFEPATFYANPTQLIEQMRFIVERYQDEPAIIAWDIRENGDMDYLSGNVDPEAVFTWITDTIFTLKQIDQNHFFTASWENEPEVLAPLVDVVSFQNFGEYQDLRQTIANLRDATTKPILLTGIGYSTFNLDETAQRNLLFQAFEEVANNEVAGWIVYMAFDYPTFATCIEPNCPGEVSAVNRFGLWNTSYFPKLAVDAVEYITGVSNE